jgi:hypothetical protein
VNTIIKLWIILVVVLVGAIMTTNVFGHLCTVTGKSLATRNRTGNNNNDDNKIMIINNDNQTQPAKIEVNDP